MAEDKCGTFTQSQPAAEVSRLYLLWWLVSTLQPNLVWGYRENPRDLLAQDTDKD